MKTKIPTKCCILNDEGRRCNKPATKSVKVFLDPELYPYAYTWVRIEVCDEHYEELTK